MNIKKFVATLAALLLLGTSAFAEINLKDIGGGKVSITFLFKDSSSEMGVIGSFDNWTVPGEPMTKNADGLWEKTIEALATDELVYKFYSKGTWIFDEMAPDKKDDGYGGFNGLIVVADILSGVTPMKPGVVAVAPKVKKGPVGRPKVTFGTDTWVESDTSFNTAKGKFDPLDSAINAKSVWKFEGDLVPNMPGHLIITAFDGHSKVMEKGKLEVADGLQNLASGTIFNPLYYLGGNQRPQVDQFRFGVDTPYLVWETGYANSILPVHKAILWDTVSDANKANAGYSLFRLGPKARTLGDLTVDAAIVPNKSLDGYFGLYSFASVEASGLKAEVQYDMKSSTKTEAGKWFDNASRQDVIVGGEAYFDDFVVQGQFLQSLFTAGGTYDLMPASEKMAAKVVAGYRDVYGSTEAMLGWAYRGGNFSTLNGNPVVKSSAVMLYAANDDVLGAVGTQVLSFNGFLKFGYWGTAKVESSLTSAASGNPDLNKTVAVKPGFVLNLDALNVYPVTIDLYGQAKYNTQPAKGTDTMRLTAAGAKAAFKALDLYYKADNSTSVLFNTVLAEATVAPDLKAQAGVGLRSGSGVDNTLGLVVGASYVIPAPEAKTPKAYAQFVYNMDPYNAEGASTYDLTDFGPTNGAAGSDGLGALRVGLSWSY